MYIQNILISTLFIFQLIYFLMNLIICNYSNNNNYENKLVLFNRIIGLILLTTQITLFSYFCKLFTTRNKHYVVVNQLINDAINQKYWSYAILSNPSGILLFWYTLLVLTLVFVELYFRDIENIHGVLAIISGFAIVILFSAMMTRPFATEDIPTNSFGLSPSLQSPYMLFHPIFSFLAYSLSIIPYAIYTMNKNTTDKIIKRLDRLSLIISFNLLVAIYSGAIWSFEVLWGGFWTWDIVENLSLMLFLASILPIHLKKYSKEIRMFSHAVIFPLVLFSTFTIRSGLISSNHTYTSTTNIIGYFLIFAISLIPFIKVKIKNQLSLDLSLSDNGESVWLFSVFVIQLFIIISTITILIYNMISKSDVTYPNYIFHYLVTLFLIIPIILVIILDLKRFQLLSSKNIQNLLIIFTLSFILSITYNNSQRQSISIGVYVYLLILLGFIFISYKINKPIKIENIKGKHISRLIVHILFLFFIFSLLISHYSMNEQITAVTENKTKVVFNKPIKVVNYKMEANIVTQIDQKGNNLTTWKLKLMVLIDNKINQLIAGWNPIHGYYSIPSQHTYLYYYYQVEIKLISNQTYMMDYYMGNNLNTTIFLNVRTLTGGIIYRIVQTSFILSFLLPILISFKKSKDDDDYYN